MTQNNSRLRRNFWIFGIFIVVPTAVRYFQIHTQINKYLDLLVELDDKPSRKPGRKSKNRKRSTKRPRRPETATRKNTDFLEEHLQIKKLYVAEQLQINTKEGTNRKAAEAGAKQLFVDLEKDPKSRDDPWFVLHIGPPKTATTSIQCGLEKHSLRLAKTDGYHFLGGGCGVSQKEYYMPNGEQTVLRLSVMTSLVSRKKAKDDELSKLIARSRYLRQNGRSVVLSSELFGSKFPSSPRVMNMLKNTLISQASGAGFSPERVRIVLAYRHFVDWLPSFHFQKYFSNVADKPWLLKDPSKVRVKPFLQYADEYLSSWEEHERKVAENDGQEQEQEIDPDEELSDGDGNEDGNEEVDGSEGDDDNDKEDESESEKKLLELSLPWDRHSIHPTWWLYQLWSSYFPLPNQVQVYDMHSPMNSNRPNDDTVINFICSMLPDANQTCSRLMFLEDERERENEEHSNGTVAAKAKKSKSSGGSDVTEPDYDNLLLHSKLSWLYQNRMEPAKGVGDPSASSGGGINVRTSSDHHAVMLVEEMLIKGDIPYFDYSGYGSSFFETFRFPNETHSVVHNGHGKKSLIKIAQKLLDKHDIKTPNEKYFDCMSKDLEDRLLKASLTFVDLIYKQTEMLSLAATVSTISGGTNTATTTTTTTISIEDEKEKRFTQALAEHSRLFEKNKAKGKYCDINPYKVFKEISTIYETMASLSFKPIYMGMRSDQIPARVMPHVKTLGLEKNSAWQKMQKSRGFGDNWKELSPNEKAAAFALGLKENRSQKQN
jgi:hypothetical protein